MTEFIKKHLAPLRSAALNGDCDAQYKLGMAYFGHDDIEEDIAQAIVWMRKAAEQGDHEAQNSLGHMYLMAGDSHNSDEAIRWFKSAAKLGNAAAAEALEQLFNQ